MSRLAVLLAGPVLLVWGSYAVTVGRTAARTVDTASAVFNASREFDVRDLRAHVEDGLAALPKHPSLLNKQKSLAVACDRQAGLLAKRLPRSFHVLSRPPYVLAGDLGDAAIDLHYRETILPTARSLSLMYFDRQPDEPISLLLFSSEQSYREASLQFDNRSAANYHGYYIRTDRRMMINVSTGEGTLSHELTHALAHFDFPQMPEWFDEGLGSLHEECVFSTDGLRLIGQSNWRLNHLLHAMHHRKLGTLEGLLASRTIRSEQQATDYAQARYFCLYLQDRDLLTHFYRKFRANVENDASGVQTLREIFNVESIDVVDRDFRNWVVDLYEQDRKAPARR